MSKATALLVMLQREGVLGQGDIASVDCRWQERMLSAASHYYFVGRLWLK